MIAYKYDFETKEYIGIVECQIDPLVSEIKNKIVYLLPGNSTFIEPPEAKENYKIIFDGNNWKYEEIILSENNSQPEFTEKELIAQQINELKKKLRSLDYKTIKHTQGELSEEEWAETISICKSYRAQINELEEKLNNL